MLTVEIYKNGLSNRNIYNEVKTQKAIEPELGCEFIKINPYNEDFDILKTINEIFRYIKQPSNNW